MSRWRATHREECVAYDARRRADRREQIAAASTEGWRRFIERQSPEMRALLKDVKNQVARALRRGDLVRPDSCSRCGRTSRIEAAHADYNQPLAVTWLCRSCHVMWDAWEPKTRLWSAA
jgi:hypothetical protein